MDFLACVCDASVQQGSSASDGFLDDAEYSVWASTMKLQEDEAHPTLRESHFMSLPTDAQPQVYLFLLLPFFVSVS